MCRYWRKVNLTITLLQKMICQPIIIPLNIGEKDYHTCVNIEKIKSCSISTMDLRKYLLSNEAKT